MKKSFALLLATCMLVSVSVFAEDAMCQGYPLSNNTYIVLRKDTPEDAPARKMTEFMLSEEGQMCVETAGYGKLR